MKVITVTANPAIDITAQVDEWTRGEVNRGQSVAATAGGKGINVAINLAHSGCEVYATGWLGRENEAIFHKAFEKERINDDFIRIEGETRRNIKIVDPKRDETTDFNMPGVNVGAQAQKALEAYLDKHVTEATVLVFGGSLPPGVARDYYATMTAKYRGKCHFLVVDASGSALNEVLKADTLPDMIKPNIHELREATGKALDTDDAVITEARAWIKRGITMMVVSLGSEGAWFVTEKEAIKAFPLDVEVTSTVGAGDAMVAGTVCGVIIGCSLADTACTATAYSAANIENIGAGLPNPTRLDSLKSQVKIEKKSF